MEPVKLFIGSSSNGEDQEIELAYEYSLRKNTKRELDITWMRQSNDPESPWHGWNTKRWSTPFSGFRWAIPYLCDFKGKAIYTDVDMINFRDIGDLWDTDLQGRLCAARPGTRFGGFEFCVTVFDCAQMGRFFPINNELDFATRKEEQTWHHGMIDTLVRNPNLVLPLDPRWNCLDGEDRPLSDIWQLHYTNMATQPWEPDWYVGPKKTHPRQDVVDVMWDTLNAALDDPSGKYRFTEIPEDQLIKNYNIIGK